MPLSLRVSRQLKPALAMTSDKKLVRDQNRLLAPMLEEEDQEAPRDQGEGVYQEVLGVTWVVQIGRTEVAKRESRWRFLEARSQPLNQRQETKVQVIPQTEH